MTPRSAQSATASTAVAWNGGRCHICNSGYLGSHRCDPEALVRRAHELLDMARREFDARLAASTPVDIEFRRSCPCRTENGGSGVCGCTLGGPTVTC